jgi:hypothetical protein
MSSRTPARWRADGLVAGSPQIEGPGGWFSGKVFAAPVSIGVMASSGLARPRASSGRALGGVRWVQETVTRGYVVNDPGA